MSCPSSVFTIVDFNMMGNSCNLHRWIYNTLVPPDTSNNAIALTSLTSLSATQSMPTEIALAIAATVRVPTFFTQVFSSMCHSVAWCWDADVMLLASRAIATTSKIACSATEALPAIRAWSGFAIIFFVTFLALSDSFIAVATVAVTASPPTPNSSRLKLERVEHLRVPIRKVAQGFVDFASDDCLQQWKQGGHHHVYPIQSFIDVQICPHTEFWRHANSFTIDLAIWSPSTIWLLVKAGADSTLHLQVYEGIANQTVQQSRNNLQQS
mmetsp:Transcript_16686/g.26530  ORF Transcript_16686/g.26530 Transcript_16686/m.26530 type:complete len:268 (-) Transcript_16686:434-1237(-)